MQRSCGEEHEGPKVSSVAREQKARRCGRGYMAGKVTRGQDVGYKTRKDLLLRLYSERLRTWMGKNYIPIFTNL